MVSMRLLQLGVFWTTKRQLWIIIIFTIDCKNNFTYAQYTPRKVQYTTKSSNWWPICLSKLAFCCAIIALRYSLSINSPSPPFSPSPPSSPSPPYSSCPSYSPPSSSSSVNCSSGSVLECGPSRPDDAAN